MCYAMHGTHHCAVPFKSTAHVSSVFVELVLHAKAGKAHLVPIGVPTRHHPLIQSVSLFASYPSQIPSLGLYDALETETRLIRPMNAVAFLTILVTIRRITE